METVNVVTEREEILRLKSLIKTEYEKFNSYCIELRKNKQSIINAIDKLDKSQNKCVNTLASIEQLTNMLASVVYSSAANKEQV